LKTGASPAKEKALVYGIKLVQPETLKDEIVYEQLQKLAPELIVVAAYGKMIPSLLLGLPEFGCVNIHPSLLPKYRGSSPIASAILNGDAVTGISIMLLDSGMDSGPIIKQTEVPISDEDTTGSLTVVMADISAKLLIDTLPLWIDGKIKLQPQNEQQATYTKTITKSDGEINWQLSAVELWRRVRAFNPWPRCYTWFKGKHLEVTEAIPLSLEETGQPGQVITLPRSAPSIVGVMTGDGVLGLLRVKLEGKKEMPVDEFIRGQRDFVGSKL